jgi:hypothetical protein
MPNIEGAYGIINAFKSVDAFPTSDNLMNELVMKVMNLGVEDRKNLKDFLNKISGFYAEVQAGDPYPDIPAGVGMTHDQLMDREYIYNGIINALRGREPGGNQPESYEPESYEPEGNQFGGRRRRRAHKHKKTTRKHRNKNKSKSRKSRKNKSRRRH